MKTSTPRRLLRYVTRCLRLGRYLADPGDGRPQPQIPARVLLWALVLGRLLREPSFHGVEQLVRSSACRALGVYQSFGDDTLSYFTERLDPARMRAALIEILRRTKRNKAFHNSQRIEIWDADDFDPWETLHWSTVRVIRYRQHKPDGSLVQADWLTDFSSRQLSSLSLYHMAKSRWEIENQGFNDAKNRYGFEHICHHHANSVLISWLLSLLAMVIERLYRLRYLHRGNHPVRSAEQLCRLFWLSLSHSLAPNSS